MKIYDLPVMGYDRAKSFYGKAWWDAQPIEA